MCKKNGRKVGTVGFFNVLCGAYVRSIEGYLDPRIDHTDR